MNLSHRGGLEKENEQILVQHLFNLCNITLLQPDFLYSART